MGTQSNNDIFGVESTEKHNTLLNSKNWNSYYQEKFDYYKKYNMAFVLVSCIMSILYVFIDSNMFGRFSSETCFYRFAPIITTIVYILTSKITNKYSYLYFIMQLQIHIIIWCTLFAMLELPYNTHSDQALIIVIFTVFMGCLGSPFSISVISFSMMLLNFMLSNMFTDFDDSRYAIAVGFPICVTSLIALAILSKLFFNNYKEKHNLVSSIVLDPITGAYNKNILSKITKNNKFIFDRKKAISILMLELDKYDNLFSEYGRKDTDVILRSVTDSLHSCVRGNDYIIRWTASSFAIFMLNCPIEEATGAAERIRKNIEKIDTSICPVTVSIGISEYKKEDYLSDINQANKALYIAKKTGMNKTINYHDYSKEDTILESLQ